MPSMKQYKIDGTDLTFWAEDYGCACQVVNEIGEHLIEWAKSNGIEHTTIPTSGITEQLITNQLLKSELGFERVNPETGAVIPDDCGDEYTVGGQ